eukprot:m.219967 g.219967  ORF g.219967 m.219967 type:complete len:383 (-) comp10285_c0_seq1:69-1217(-)
MSRRSSERTHGENNLIPRPPQPTTARGGRAAGGARGRGPKPPAAPRAAAGAPAAGAAAASEQAANGGASSQGKHLTFHQRLQLLQQTIASNPYRTHHANGQEVKERQGDRSAMWGEVAEALKTSANIDLDAKGARERVSRMLKQFLAEERGALFKSGTEEEVSLMQEALTSIQALSETLETHIAKKAQTTASKEAQKLSIGERAKARATYDGYDDFSDDEHPEDDEVEVIAGRSDDDFLESGDPAPPKKPDPPVPRPAARAPQAAQKRKESADGPPQKISRAEAAAREKATAEEREYYRWQTTMESKKSKFDYLREKIQLEREKQAMQAKAQEAQNSLFAMLAEQLRSSHRSPVNSPGRRPRTVNQYGGMNSWRITEVGRDD